MAAFSHQQQHSHPHPPFFLDSSVFLPNSFINMSGSLEEVSINNISSYFPYSSPSEPFQHISSFDAKLLPTTSNNEPYVTEKKQRADSSSMVVDLDANSDHQLTQKSTPMDNKRKNHLSDGSCLSSAESKEPKQAKAKKQRKCNQNLKEKEEKKNKECKKTKKEVSDQVPPSGYVHVRARRGEATDSHSLAERVRRERISERLKMLQALVPGCDKVSSKALMLDEIINYVQSLQHQVEFLSMKLSSVSPMFYDFGGMDLDSLVIKPEIPSTLASQLQSVQQSIPTPSTTFADITSTYSTTNNYPLLDNSLSLLLQQGLSPNDISQDNGSLLWGVDEQRQRISNQSDLTNLCSFQ